MAEKLDIDDMHFEFEDAKFHLSVWIDDYATNPEWDENVWVEHPKEYRNALACGFNVEAMDGSEYYSIMAPLWIPTWDVKKLKNLFDFLADGTIDSFEPTPSRDILGEEYPPLQYAVKCTDGKRFITVTTDGGDRGFEVTQELTDELIAALQKYFTLISSTFPQVD